MSIASAIAALSPNLWYPLDTIGSTTEQNAGSLNNDGTWSGAYEQGVEGPENGTYAARLYTTGQIVSGAMDVGGLAPMTIGMWLSTDASGATGTSYPIVNIGDVGNRGARGPLIYELHNSIGTPMGTGRWGTGTAQAQFPEPRKFWHWLVFSFASGTNGLKMYIDGSLLSQVTISSPVAAQLTDPLLIRCDEPIVICHVTFWNRVLSQVEVQSVSNEIAQWPYTVPINRMPDTEAGGGGGLTEDQAAQLGRIEGYTDDIPGIVDAVSYIADTVNTINGLSSSIKNAVDHIEADVHRIEAKVDEILAGAGAGLDEKVDSILDAVQRAFITSAGIGLNSPIGLLLAHPDPNLLHATNESFVISGQGTLSPPGPLGYGNVYGIRWIATTVPPQVGHRVGIIPTFVRRLVQFVLWYTDVGDLQLHACEIEDFYWAAFTYLWKRPFPNTIQYDVCPGFELTCRWILLAPIEPP